ncbi:MAG: YcxB family protein [Brevundimonas sp.]|nr:YcxB family protein [Brevundimonas sp.]
MIEIEAVQPTAREFRSISRGWGAIHWVCIPYTYAFLFGFLIYGLVASSLAEDVLPPLLFSGTLFVTWLVWFVSAWVVRKVSSREAAKAPTGSLPWKWSIGADGIVFANGLQTNKVDWRAIKTVREESDRFLFLVTPAYNPILPKRLLDEPQLAALRGLIADVTASGRLGRGVD